MRQRLTHRRGNRARGLGALIRRAFRERQIYLRSEGDVRFVTLGPWKQAGALLLLLLSFFWLAYASFSMVLSGHFLARSDERGPRERLDYEDRLAELRDTVDRLNDRLLLDQSDYLEKVDEVRTDYEKLVERHRILTEFLLRGSAKGVPEAEPPTGSQDGLRGPTGDLAPIPNQPTKGSLNELTFQQKYAREFRTIYEAIQPLAELRQRFGEFEELQLALLDEAAQRSRSRARTARKLLAQIGLAKTRLDTIATADAAAVGGPFIAASLGSFGSEELSDRLEAAIQTFTDEERLHSQIDLLPLRMPITGTATVTSRFGLRRDPFRRVPALHSGVDLKAAYGSSVVATAPGTVVKAGWDGAYGRSVEIAHDNGISTVYAHMRKITVKFGQRVAKGDIVGLLGSTGRSTGPHLHYETRIGGRAIDPARFWKARNALQAISQ